MPKTSPSEPIDKPMAVELLKSALGYMQQAGFVILKAEHGDLLWLGFSELSAVEGELHYHPAARLDGGKHDSQSLRANERYNSNDI